MQGHGARVRTGYGPRPADERELIPTVERELISAVERELISGVVRELISGVVRELIPGGVRLLAFVSIRVSYPCPFAVCIRGEKGGAGLGDRGREGGSVSRGGGNVLG